MTVYDMTIRTPAAETVREMLRGLRVGETTTIHDVEVLYDEDEWGRSTGLLVLTLNDPPPGEGTWPLEDILRIYRLVHDDASTLLGLPCLTQLRPTTVRVWPEQLDAGGDGGGCCR